MAHCSTGCRSTACGHYLLTPTNVRSGKKNFMASANQQSYRFYRRLPVKDKLRPASCKNSSKKNSSLTHCIIAFVSVLQLVRFSFE